MQWLSNLIKANIPRMHRRTEDVLLFVPFIEYQFKMSYPLFERFGHEFAHRGFIEDKAVFVGLVEIAE